MLNLFYIKTKHSITYAINRPRYHQNRPKDNSISTLAFDIQGKLINQYLKIKKIGEGPYSKIKLMKNIDNNKMYAMKKYNLFILKKKNKLLKKEKGVRTHIYIYSYLYHGCLRSITRSLDFESRKTSKCGLFGRDHT